MKNKIKCYYQGMECYSVFPLSKGKDCSKSPQKTKLDSKSPAKLAPPIEVWTTSPKSCITPKSVDKSKVVTESTICTAKSSSSTAKKRRKEAFLTKSPQPQVISKSKKGPAKKKLIYKKVEIGSKASTKVGAKPGVYIMQSTGGGIGGMKV